MAKTLQQQQEFDPTTVVVTINEIVTVIGVHEVVRYWMRKLGIEAIEDWQGQPAVRATDARRLVETYRGDKARHGVQWEAYQQHLQERREAQRRQRQEELAAQRERIRQERDEFRRRVAERRLQEREQELAAAAAAESERGPSFEKWLEAHS